MSRYAWVITADYISNDDSDRDGKDSVPVDIKGPSGATSAQLAMAASDGVPFRMYDDDGILYYAGKCWSSDYSLGKGIGEEFFGPLEDYGTPNAGAVTIKYRDPATGKWDAL